MITGSLVHKQVDRKGRHRSTVWQKFHEIYSKNTNEIVKYFYFCVSCEHVVPNLSSDSNTNRLIRHKCSNEIENYPLKEEKTNFSKLEKETVKAAAANFVALDLRPYAAIEGEGLFDLCYAVLKLGQKNRKMQRSDLKSILPSRNTVRSTVSTLASSTREKISKLMTDALKTGGIAATTDTWTDDYQKRTYIYVVAHLCIHENDELKYYRFVLSTSEVSEYVKTGI